MRLLLTRVVFEGNRVRITGVISMAAQNPHGGIATTASWDDGRNASSDSGRIADTMSRDCGRNQPGLRAVTETCVGPGVSDEVEFELIRPIVKLAGGGV